MSRNQYVTDLTATVHELFADGVKDPSAVQITRRYWGEDKAVSNGMVEEVRAKLGRIRRLLDEDGHLTCPLSDSYYRKFRRSRQPLSRAEASQCLPTRGRPQTGILFLDGGADADLIWTEWISMQCNQAAGKAKLTHDEVLLAFDQGKITGEQAQDIIGQSRRLAAPTRVAIAERLEFGDALEVTSS